jgi:hypothetical protein
MLSVVMLEVPFFFCYAECAIMLNVMLNVVMLSVVVPNFGPTVMGMHSMVLFL